MREFAELFRDLEETTSSNGKQEALLKFFSTAPEKDQIYVIAFLSGNRPKRAVKVTDMRAWGAEAAAIPLWLFEECYENVGDLAETISLLVKGSGTGSRKSLSDWVEEVILPLGKMTPEEQKETLTASWRSLGNDERFVFTKLISGGFRIGVSTQSIVKALSAHTGIDQNVMTHRLMGKWQPTLEFYRYLVSKNEETEDISKPYPFCLANPLDVPHESLGDSGLWLAEWKYDGIRAQLIKRRGEVFIWSRGEEIINDQFPEIVESTKSLPDSVVLDGELLIWEDNSPQSFAKMQKRIGRKTVSQKMMKEYPVSFLVFDILELSGQDIRSIKLAERREKLEALLKGGGSGRLVLSPSIQFSDFEELEEIRSRSRERSVEGVMLKRLDSVYQTGRKRGDWWKWKVDPWTVDAVLLYAQAGHGRRAGLFTDYTFAVWDHGRLVPFAKAYSGLTDEEIVEVDRFVKQNTIEKFGPVRSVTPKLVFEIAFEGIQLSSRHKCGIAVRFPRIARWRKDLIIKDADSLGQIKKLVSPGTM